MKTPTAPHNSRRSIFVPVALTADEAGLLQNYRQMDLAQREEFMKFVVDIAACAPLTSPPVAEPAPTITRLAAVTGKRVSP
jgi:hypothetical protein